MTMRVRLVPNDEGVSPVVGMILVLGISIVGIAAILYWGLPAIDEMKANVEHKSVEAQFEELDSSIKELVAGTTEKTAKRWQPTMNRGQVLITNESEGWVYSLETYDATWSHSFVWGEFGDGNYSFHVTSIGNKALAAMTLQAYRVDSTTSGQDLVVSRSESGTVNFTQESWAIGDTKMFYLRDGPNEVPIKNATIRFRIYEGSVKIAEAWYIPTGRIDYKLEAGAGTKTLSENNGAVLSGDGSSHTIINSPPVPPVSTTGNTPRFFARAVYLNGAGSFAGNDRFDVLVTLYSTTLLGGYDCALATHADCIEGVKIHVFGNYRDPWYAYLKNTGKGYTFTESTVNGVTYLEDREPWMGFTLLQSSIDLSVSK